MLYLVSGSPRRRRILKEHGVKFQALTPDYLEEKIPGKPPSAVVRIHAMGKAMSAVKKIVSGTILAADTIVYFDGKIIGKPGDLKEAAKILNRLQGKWHTVYTGVMILRVRPGRPQRKEFFFETTHVLLKKLDRKMIRSYFQKVNPLDKAGAYAIQSKRFPIVQEIRGSFSNAMGLPIEKVLLKGPRRLKMAL